MVYWDVKQLPKRRSVAFQRYSVPIVKLGYADYGEPHFADGSVAWHHFGHTCDNAPLVMLDNTTMHFSFIGGLRVTPAPGCDIMAQLSSIAARRRGTLEPPLKPEEDMDIIVR